MHTESILLQRRAVSIALLAMARGVLLRHLACQSPKTCLHRSYIHHRRQRQRHNNTIMIGFFAGPPKRCIIRNRVEYSLNSSSSPAFSQRAALTVAQNVYIVRQFAFVSQNMFHNGFLDYIVVPHTPLSLFDDFQEQVRQVGANGKHGTCSHREPRRRGRLQREAPQLKMP